MKICDAHTDFLTEIKQKEEREQYVKQIKKVVGDICCAVFTTNSTTSVKDVENFKLEIENYNKKMDTKLLLAVEDLGFVKTKNDLFNLIELKPFSVTLTWNEKNQFAGGANTKSGLTKLGKDVITILEDNNILIDTAHLSRKAFFQFARITKKPIFNSHTNIDKLFRHNRNLTDKQINKIVRSCGFVGLTFYEKFISHETITSRDVALQFDYLIKKFGYKYFGIGSDLFGVENKFLPSDLKSYFDIKNLIAELKKLNYSNKIIKAIINKNFKKFKNNIKKS